MPESSRFSCGRRAITSIDVQDHLMRLMWGYWEPTMSVSDWADSSICDYPSRQYNCTGRVFFTENHTFINHHFLAWIHSSTPMDAHILCPFSAFYINIELTNAVPDAPPVAEIFDNGSNFAEPPLQPIGCRLDPLKGKTTRIISVHGQFR